MLNFIAFRLPLTHAGTYCMTIVPQTPGPLTIEVTMVLPVDPTINIKQEPETPLLPKMPPKYSKFFESPHSDEQPMPTSDCHEKSPFSSLFNIPLKDTSRDGASIDDGETELESKDEHTKTALSEGHGLFLAPYKSQSSQDSLLLPDSISTFILTQCAQALYGAPSPIIFM
ncbi:hypothetical protein V8B97DRAFT_1920134 [Scleroderma yunnanense]